MLTVDSMSQIVDKTIMEADQDRDGKISFEEFTKMVENTDVSMSMTLGTRPHSRTAMNSRLAVRLLVFDLARRSRSDIAELSMLTVQQINSNEYPLAK